MTVLQNFQLYLQDKTKELDMIFFKISEKPKSKLKAWGDWIPFIVSIYIKLFAYFYEYLSKKLTDFENHQKQGEYDNSYIIKNFFFGLINEYYTFYYIIFFQARENCNIKGKSCSEYLTYQLRAILYTSLTINLLKETVKP